jgi:Cyanobacterial TRADD-N associated 2-Transmembrane domain
MENISVQLVVIAIALAGVASIVYAAWATDAFRKGGGVPVVGKGQGSGDLLDSRDQQYRLSKDYHQQGLAQSRISFWFSLIFASLGFVLIAVSVIPSKDVQHQQTWIGMVSGTIIDAVSALFFVQSNRAREQMAAFFDKLRADQKLLDALQLCRNIGDVDLRNRLQTVLALSLSDTKITEQMVASLARFTFTDAAAGDCPQENRRA